MPGHQPVQVDLKDRRVQYTHLPLEMIDSGDFRQLLDLWNRKRGSQRIPARADFDPLELKMILPRLMLIEVVDDPPDFRYRLAGTASRELTGLDWTGHSVLDLVPRQHGLLLWNCLCDMQQDLQPQYVSLSVISRLGEPLRYRVLRLPLGCDGETMDRVLVVQDFGTALPLLRRYFDRVREAQVLEAVRDTLQGSPRGP
ncbi:PAS domain-containing protein [Ferrovibrio xuzhouensis]|uniref:PAS domain-containing protein n=1 Tax=Ferrovibrio xuzhouensis TaxID=1576914 RepID=A0ABV7VHR2_9PROT